MPKLVLTNGVFDILHAGHVHFLQNAKAHGDRLLVCLNTDDSVKRLKGNRRPINPLVHRVAVIHALRCVDAVCAFDTERDLERIIDRERPDILAKAGYTLEQITGADIVRSYGGEVLIFDRESGLSTTEILLRGKREL